MTLAILNREELRAIAFARSPLFSTISTTNDCLTGMSNPAATPSKTLSTIICHTVTTSKNVSSARDSACSAANALAAIIIFRRSRRSDRTPAKGARRKAGKRLAKITVPRSVLEPVTR